MLTLSSGPGASLKVAQNHLIAQDGGTELKFRRAACPVSRVVVVRSEGFITIPALRWLHEVGSALVVLQYDGTPIAVTVPRVIGPATLRRTQAATTIETRLGKAIAGCLIRAKLAGQIATLRDFDRGAAAVEIGAIAEGMQRVPARPGHRFSPLRARCSRRTDTNRRPRCCARKASRPSTRIRKSLR